MGEHDVTAHSESQERDNERLRAFTRALLEDVRVLEEMLATPGTFETGVRRLGAEQEMFLVDGAMRPSSIGADLIGELPEGPFTTELGRFNLEINLSPREYAGRCLAEFESELAGNLEAVRTAAARHGARVALVGILPTLEASHLTLDWMTPNPRYFELNRALTAMRGGAFQTQIKGLDELSLGHDNVMLEACNTSFQVHFQVGPEEFVPLYNLAQLVTAPVLAVATNSPLLLGRRLWHETRVALFQQSLDARHSAEQARGHRTRVSFGDRWLENSMIELLREDVARFRSIISTEVEEDSAEVLRAGGVPRLRAWCLFNGTVYRWNRPCYGITKTPDGPRPHLRIENRVLPAGPSVVDAVANAAFFFGLMSALGDEVGDVPSRLAFESARANFMAASRYGLKANFTWIDRREVSAQDLALELLPVAQRGLESHGVAPEDVERYLGTIERRVTAGRTGSQWLLDSLAQLPATTSLDVRLRKLTRRMIEEQESGRPVAEWATEGDDQGSDWRDDYRSVGQVMTRDVFTVHPEDLVDLAASLMEWEHVRHVPVEDHQGRLVGLVGHRALLRMVGRGVKSLQTPVAVREIMRHDPLTISPDASTLDAMRTMREHRVSCLPVVQDGRLVGIVTEHDFVEVARALLEKELEAE